MIEAAYQDRILGALGIRAITAIIVGLIQFVTGLEAADIGSSAVVGSSTRARLSATRNAVARVKAILAMPPGPARNATYAAYMTEENGSPRQRIMAKVGLSAAQGYHEGADEEFAARMSGWRHARMADTHRHIMSIADLNNDGQIDEAEIRALAAWHGFVSPTTDYVDEIQWRCILVDSDHNGVLDEMEASICDLITPSLESARDPDFRHRPLRPGFNLSPRMRPVFEPIPSIPKNP